MFDSTLHTSLRSGSRQSSSRGNIYLRSFVMAIMYWCKCSYQIFNSLVQTNTIILFSGKTENGK